MKSTAILLPLLCSLPTALSAPTTTDATTQQLLTAVLATYPETIAITALSEDTPARQQDLADSLNISTVENDLSAAAAAAAACADVTLLFARGTLEAGTLGTLVGPPFSQALQQKLGFLGKTLAVEGTSNYAATIVGYLTGGDKLGSAQMASDVRTALASCPNTKVVMSGYSQGGQIVHNAAALLGVSTMARVSSVVIFGDPLSKTQVTGASGKTKIFCNAGDNICDGGILVGLQHLTYGLNAGAAADYVMDMAGF